jgi:hypothetical protein
MITSPHPLRNRLRERKDHIRVDRRFQKALPNNAQINHTPKDIQSMRRGTVWLNVRLTRLTAIKTVRVRSTCSGVERRVVSSANVRRCRRSQ